MSDHERIFVAYLTSGLGNRLRPLASAIAYCKKTDRTLKVYWDRITPNGCLTPLEKLFKNAFQSISLDEIADLGDRSVGLFTEKGSGHGIQREADRFGRNQLLELSQATDSPPHTCYELTLENDDDVVIVYDNNYLECVPQEESIAALRSLEPQDEIVSQVNRYIQELGLEPGMKGVHARGTDFGIESALELYSGMIRNAVNVDQKERFFLSTDDEALEKGIVEMFPGLVLTRTDRLHLKLNSGKTTWGDPDSFTISEDHGIDALADIYLLSCTDLVVYHPGSTFGEISRHLKNVLFEAGLIKVEERASAPMGEDVFSRLTQEFRQRASMMMPRGNGQFIADLAQAHPGPEYLEQLPVSFGYWESLGYNIPIMERMFLASNSRPYLEWDGNVFTQIVNAGFGNISLDIFNAFCPYPEAIPQMQTLHSYINGRNILVIGSETYWMELFCALSGAKSVTTVEYREIRWTTPPRTATQINTITWDRYTREIEQHMDRYDMVVTYSSIEHSGLGRYGDPIMPLGDLFTFYLISRSVRQNGMLAVAVPTGQDLTHFNAHRIYGEKRIRALEQIAGFKYIGIVTPPKEYIDAKEEEESLKEGWNLSNLTRLPLGTYRQPILCFGPPGFDLSKY